MTDSAYRSRLRLQLVLPLASLALLLPAPTASAVQITDTGAARPDGRVVMSPAAERIETVEADGGSAIGPGDTIVRSVTLRNEGTDTVAFDMDVAQVVGSDKELVVEIRHGVREGAAGWVGLDTSRFSLKPGQQGTVQVTIRIPEDAEPGEQSFAVTAAQTSSSGQGDGAPAPAFKQTAIFILDLPGDAQVGGGIVDVSIANARQATIAMESGEQPTQDARIYLTPGWEGPEQLMLTVVYENTGDRILKPGGEVVLTDLIGRVVNTYPVDAFTVYPGGENMQVVELTDLPTLGIFRATVELESDGAGTQSEAAPGFAIVPRPLMTAALALLSLS